MRSTFGQNLAIVARECGIDPLTITKRDLISRLSKKAVIPDGGETMIDVMKQLYAELRRGELNQEETDELKDHIDVIAVA